MTGDVLIPAWCFFFGAGASRKADVPTTVEFVSEFRKHLVSKSSKLLELHDDLVKRLEGLLEDSGQHDVRVDVELLLEALGVARNIKGNVASVFYDQGPKVFDASRLEEYRNDLKDYIRDRCIVKPEDTDYLAQFLSFRKSFERIHLFTVNYDVVVEQFADRNRLRWTDGFRLYWAPEEFASTENDVFLYKLHGSALWFRSASGRVLKVPLLSTRGVELITREPAEALMLYPAQKIDYSGPFPELLLRLQQALQKTQWMFVVGYSFRDEVITQVFSEATASNQKLRIILISPSADQVYEKQMAWSKPLETAGGGGTYKPVASPMQDRVIRLPFSFENVLPRLFNTLLGGFQSAISDEARLREDELANPQKAQDYRSVVLKYLNGLIPGDARRLLETRAPLTSFDEAQRIEVLLKMAILCTALGNSSGEDYARILWGDLKQILLTGTVARANLSQRDITYQVGGQDSGPRLGALQGAMENSVALIEQVISLGPGAVATTRLKNLQRWAVEVSGAIQFWKSPHVFQEFAKWATAGKVTDQAQVAKELEVLANGPKKGERDSEVTKRATELAVRRFEATLDSPMT